ncbi:MAG: DNA polymerase III subunit alpha [Betaproteobacteria bacterium RIFCSPLOWO2_12_FULL_64_23]|nr:MAG: DNA polymerase III subunit alpha [Betaproteobacteria bacterium RIFCSPLOWO2_12_FULL_64_23]
MTPVFVHLRLHSEFTVTDGIVRIDQAVARAAEDGMPALAITDLANLFGMVKFYKAARAQGVKPVIGCDVWISNEAERDKPSRLLLLCRNRKGFLQLSELLTRAWLENQVRGRAEIRKDWLRDQGADGLLALSGAQAGDIGGALGQDNVAQAERLAREWAQLFPQRFYIELQRAGAAAAEHYITRALALAGRLELPVVATHPVQFLKPEEFLAHEARVCIAEGYVLADQRRPRVFTPQSYFKTQAEMAQLFADIPEALANSVEIARRCNLTLELGKSKLPPFPTPAGVSLEVYLAQQAGQGLALRLAKLFPDEKERARREPEYRARLEFEIKTITQMGYPGYFLIVADFINWAKSNAVPVGPGRGSGAGSLVAYSLGITDLDPLRYDLLFERFLNPERVSMPDFDIDFCQDGRDRVIEYVKKKYGAQSVSQIATFGTMAAKAVVRDVGRVMEWNYGRTDELAKLIPFTPGKLITLAMAREMEPRLAEREQSEEETRELLALAGQLEGLTRNVGMHAGGVLIAPGKLTDFCPLYTAQGAESVVSQFDMKDVEAVGLVKFDFLGLTTLTILDWSMRHIRARRYGEPRPDFSLEAIPLDDPAIYKIFAGANTTAVFQFESRGMRDLLKQARPDRFEDIIALVALYRPGPMDLIPEFIERKQGKQRVEYLDARLQPILGPTYGIMVYQEQVMQIAQVIGGYSLGSADLLRRAMGKKNADEMAEQRDIFVAGAGKNGVDRKKASELFDLMEKFAGYGFNKSHAAAYALVACQTAYLKAHFPSEFMAANLSAVMDDTDKAHGIYADALANGLKVLPPDINSGAYRFVPVDEHSIRYGLGAVKGTGESAIGAIVRARDEGGPFRDLFDFCERIDKRVVNRRVVERLFASVGIALEAAEQRERHAQQVNLFGDAGGAGAERPALISVERWDDGRVLKEEKASLGFYLSGHPFSAYRAEVQRFVRGSLRSLQPGANGEYQQKSQLIAGVVESVRIQRTQSGRMVILNLSDGDAAQEVTIYSEVYDQCRDLCKEDKLLVIEAKVKIVRRAAAGEEGDVAFMRIIADRIYDLAAARSQFAKAIRLSINGEASRSGSAAAAHLRNLLTPYRKGNCPVSVCYHNGAASCEMRLGEDWRVRPDDELMQSLREWLRPENVQVIYP